MKKLLIYLSLVVFLACDDDAKKASLYGGVTITAGSDQIENFDLKTAFVFKFSPNTMDGITEYPYVIVLCSDGISHDPEKGFVGHGHIVQIRMVGINDSTFPPDDWQAQGDGLYTDIDFGDGAAVFDTDDYAFYYPESAVTLSSGIDIGKNGSAYAFSYEATYSTRYTPIGDAEGVIGGYLVDVSYSGPVQFVVN